MGKLIRVAIVGLVAANIVAVAPQAFARGGRVVKSGRCSAAGTWKLKLQTEDGNRLQVEFEVDVNRNGHKWNFFIKDNGKLVAKGSRFTRAPSGSFEVRKLIVNRPGTDRVVAQGRSQVTGEICRGVASI